MEKDLKLEEDAHISKASTSRWRGKQRGCSPLQAARAAWAGNPLAWMWDWTALNRANTTEAWKQNQISLLSHTEACNKANRRTASLAFLLKPTQEYDSNINASNDRWADTVIVSHLLKSISQMSKVEKELQTLYPESECVPWGTASRFDPCRKNLFLTSDRHIEKGGKTKRRKRYCWRVMGSILSITLTHRSLPGPGDVQVPCVPASRQKKQWNYSEKQEEEPISAKSMISRLQKDHFSMLGHFMQRQFFFPWCHWIFRYNQIPFPEKPLLHSPSQLGSLQELLQCHWQQWAHKDCVGNE